MSTHKNIDRICVIALVIAMVVTFLFMNGGAFGITAQATTGYEKRLFDTSRVHQIDIEMDDWEGFLETCENEEYTTCTLIIDGESYKNVGIRAKGNTSLSNVSQLGSDRYSLKIEFDHYNSAENYYGLDKLCLNNIIQDNTYMKDYLSYQLMREAGVPSPLCSYAYITVGGEDWGLYLAVEDVEDAFLQRNYGMDHGELYKPDSMSMGGGRGNGKDFDMDAFREKNSQDESDTEADGQNTDQAGGDSMPQPPDLPDKEAMPQMPDFSSGQAENGADGPGGFPSGFGMGSSDVKLQYIDDDTDSYANIFDNAKTDVSKADKKRLIQSLKALSEGENIEEVVNVDEVIRYFVVHNFVCNGDSYTGAMIHNYYLYEEDGQMSMIPWDYNLAFGSFEAQDATAQVNSPIDTPVSGGSMEDRPMIVWIFADEEYTQLYHQYFNEFLEELRVQSVEGQLDGTIPSTTDGQSADDTKLIDASGLNLSDMGSMGMGGGGMVVKGRCPKKKVNNV